MPLPAWRTFAHDDRSDTCCLNTGSLNNFFDNRSAKYRRRNAFEGTIERPDGGANRTA